MNTFKDNLKYFTRIVALHIKDKYEFESVLIDVDEYNDKFNIVCNACPHFNFTLNTGDILALTRLIDFDKFNPSEFNKKLPTILINGIYSCVVDKWINLIYKTREL